MAQPHIQTAFHAGELAPQLYARVDMAKYHSAAALMRNWFVDYHGGASTRMGTRYILQAYKSATPVRLIKFSASFTVNYILEFGQQYIRFYNNGAVVLEATTAITGASQAFPCSITDVAHGYNTGDWVFITGIGGMTQLNSNYYQVVKTGANTFTLQDLNGLGIDSTAFSAYTAGGTAARVYTLATPYAATDLALLKLSQNVTTMVLTHPSYAPYTLTLVSATNWVLAPIVFGSTVSVPTGQAAATTLGAGSVNYAYVVTAVDVNGQESGPSASATLASKLDITTTAGTNSITWTAVSGAVAYNVYEAKRDYAGAVPAGAAFGFIGSATGTAFIDTNAIPDFSVTPPIAQNPFQGAGVASYTVTVTGTYTTVPSVTVANAPAGGSTATAGAVLQMISVVIDGGAPTGTGFSVGQAVSFSTGIHSPVIVTLVVATVNGSGGILTFQPITFPGTYLGAISGAGGAVPTNPLISLGPGAAFIDVTWGVGVVSVISAGAGYTSAPAVTFSAGIAAATAVLAPASSGNPSVPIYFQQRLVLAAPTGAPQTFYMSQPGSPYNFNITDPVQADNAITGSITSGQLNAIKSMISMPSGLILLGSTAAWQVNGGTAGSAVTAINATAQTQAYNGASDVPPIISNYDILYVQAKGSIVRDLSYNFYANIYTGTDISVLSSQLFFGFLINEWAYAEEPFKIVWCVRNDGTLLSLTFVKEQEIIGWSHSDTTGLFKSVASAVETVTQGAVDAVYVCVQRTINGNTVQYIERMADRFLSSNLADPSLWCVDAAIQYNGAPATNFSGATHLAGATVTGLADGVVITPFAMPTTGKFTLGVAASVVTIGLAFTPQLTTLPIDLGEPTIQGKRKKIPAVTVRCDNTLGLSIGQTYSSLVPMKDLVVGNVGSATNTVVSTLVSADARTLIDPLWSVPGQYCIQQSLPYPATVLGVIPEITVGDTPK